MRFIYRKIIPLFLLVIASACSGSGNQSHSHEGGNDSHSHEEASGEHAPDNKEEHDHNHHEQEEFKVKEDTAG